MTHARQLRSLAQHHGLISRLSWILIFYLVQRSHSLPCQPHILPAYLVCLSGCTSFVSGLCLSLCFLGFMVILFHFEVAFPTQPFRGIVDYLTIAISPDVMAHAWQVRSLAQHHGLIKRTLMDYVLLLMCSVATVYLVSHISYLLTMSACRKVLLLFNGLINLCFFGLLVIWFPFGFLFPIFQECYSGC